MNIFDLPRDQFLGYLPELRQQGLTDADIDNLVRQYRQQNSPLAGINAAAQDASTSVADQGRREVAGGLLTKDAGATGIDAVRSLDTNIRGGLLNMLAGGGQALDAPMAAAQGLIPQGDMALEALGTAGAAMTGGGAATAPRGSLRMGMALNDKDMFHGTPDVRDLRRAGAFDQMTEGAQRISDLDAWRRLGQQIDEVGPSTPEGIDLTIARSNLLEQQRVNKPVFATPDRQMAATYADDTRAFDYQRAEPAIVSMRSNPQRILDINAGGADFRGIDLDRVKKGFRDAGVPEADIEDALNRYIVAPRSDGKLSTNDLSAVSQSLGFDAVDVANVRDAYNNNARSAPGTVRMMFNSEQIDLGDMQMLANADTSGGLLATAASDALTPSQQMARRILDMRAAGRARDVTDDMMAQADPQYMFNNTPLPMDEASRMARAQDAGFPVYEYDGKSYHLTPNDIKAFSDGPTWARVNSDTNPAAHNVGRNYDVSGANDMPIFMRGDRAMPFEAREMPGGDILPYAAPSEWVDAMGQAGKSRYELGNERISTNPANIRSQFARFDPEFAHLSNLNAANASPTAGLLAMPAQQEKETELPFMNFLKGLLQ